ncbi:MAG TPA: sulfatase-like hydrolase/transferase [Thermoanaerobaculia bacterium]|nr:sulfatase-like hydrolase/transferase [Thermoanaerobaculia bacterium]
MIERFSAWFCAPLPDRAATPISRLLCVFLLLPLLSFGGCNGKGGEHSGTPGTPGTPGNIAAGRLNLVLVTIDTLRADHVGCYGAAAAETPALDALAAAGIRFAHASSPVPLTLPAHASILSGLLPPHHGVRQNGAGALPAATPTLATRLAAAGYRTGAFVAAFVLDHRFGLQAGFETYDDEVARDPRASWVLEARRPADQVVDRALAWLAKDDGRRPFFLWVHLYDAHAPYDPPSPQRERHRGSPYDGAIAFADQQLGRLLAEIDRHSGRERTVVAAAADHGESLGEHGELTHGLLLYEPALAVPMLLRAPGLPSRVIATPAGLVDLAPTLAGLLGQPLPAARPGTADGRDLSGALRAGAEPPAADLYAETRYPEIFGWTPLTAVRRRDLKYIAAAPALELYDLARDPHETANLAAIGAAGAPGAAGSPAPPAPPAPVVAAGPIRATAAAAAAGGDDRRLHDFAQLLATIESIEAASAGAPGVATPAPAPDAETRARLASLGYVAAVAPGGARSGIIPGSAAGAGPNGAARAGAPSRERLDSRRQVELFQRFERSHDELVGGHGERAIADLAALVAADPHNPVFRAKLAQTLRERGQLERAIPLYRQAAADAAADPEAWYNLASALQEAGRMREARTAIERALRLDPGRPEAHNTLGIVYLAEKQPERARQEFERAAAADPRNAHAWNNLGNVLRALGRPEESARAYRRAVETAPSYAEPWNGLGTLEVERDRPAAALPYFDRALALAPGYLEVRLNRAIACQLAGDTAAAEAAYRDFLTMTERQPQFAGQRQAARQFLAQLARSQAGAHKPEGGS